MVDRIEEGTTPSTYQLKSFLIKDILNIPDEGIPKGNKNVKAQIQEPLESAEVKESIRDLVKKTQSLGKKEMNSKVKQTSRSPFQEKQRTILEKHFEETKYVTLAVRRRLAGETDLTERQVKTWFQNRRTRWRKAHGNGALSKSTSVEDDNENVSAGEILSNFHEKLSSECVSQIHKQLTEKLH